MVRWHLPGILCGSVAAAMMMTLAETPGHRGTPLDQLIGWSRVVVILASLTPVFVGFLLCWDATARRFPKIESSVLLRLAALLAFAAVIAATLQFLITLGLALWLSNRDNVSFTSLWENPFAYREFYAILFVTTAAWALPPRLLFSIRLVDRAP